jgi:phosphoglycolate phosphatase
MRAAGHAGVGIPQIVQSAAHVLLDFDGPVCDVFAGVAAPAVAEQFRAALRRKSIDIPVGAREADDPLEVFNVVADVGYGQAEKAQRILAELESQAARAARPTVGSDDLMAAAWASGRTVTIVSNNSSAAIAAYLGDHGLAGYVTAIVGRDETDPVLMRPIPYRVRMAVSQLRADPREALFVGDTPADVPDVHLAGVAVVGLANEPGKAGSLARAGADAVTASLPEISAALLAAPRA